MIGPCPPSSRPATAAFRPNPVPAVPDHGGALARAAARHGRPAAGWLDLSTGINPRPWPFPHALPPLPAEVWTRLPDDDLARPFEAAARAYTGAPEAACVIAAPGSQALIQALPWLRPPGRVAVVGPTYAEHVRCWRLAGHATAEVADLDEAEAAASVVVLTNPNNPDGRSVPPATLVALADRLAARGGLLVVDEAFADVTPEVSVAAVSGRPGLVVLRSFGKFFGLAGLRLGFALSAPDLGAGLAGILGPWAASGPAFAFGTRAMTDAAWIARTRADLTEDAAAVDAVLHEAGLTVLGGTSLFRLAEVPDAAAFADRLAATGILVRPFSYHPQWLRFGLPATAAELSRLRRALLEAAL